ncbi:MAG: trypsin-like serine protease [Chloroflexi bacterium]|nr:trypsin-like serine protease [Chloroflexota bacterium]
MRNALFSIALVSACTSDLLVDEESRPIIGGTYDKNDLSVVGLATSGGDIFCSGTLVAPHIILTAGHCVEFGAPESIYFGSNPAKGGQFALVASALAHPDFDYDTLDNDIAVVLLAEDPPEDAELIPLMEETPAVGADARFVGFGFTEVEWGGDYGLKYQVTAPITAVDDSTFAYGIATCNGDSGGPAFITVGGKDAVAGITSWGDPTCEVFGVDTRVDAYLDWLTPILADDIVATCIDDDLCAQGCDEPDPDCPCAEDGLCTTACADWASDPDCPPECLADEVCWEECPERDEDCPIVPEGGDCARDFDCGENLCVDSACRRTCASSSECLDGEACAPVDEADVCLPVEEGCQCKLATRAPGWKPSVFLAIASFLFVSRQRRPVKARSVRNRRCSDR